MIGKRLFARYPRMHTDRAIAAGLGAAYVLFTLWCVVKGSRKYASVAQPSAGAGAGMLWFGQELCIWWFVTIALCALGFSSDLFLGKVSPDEFARFGLTFGAFSLLAGLGTWILLRYRVEYDEEAIVVHSPLGTRRRIDWTDVVSVQQIKGTGLVIVIQGQKREVIPSLLAGASDFVESARLRKRG